jgi:hypothetical protein
MEMIQRSQDPEPVYFTSEIMAYSGENDQALRLLRRAIEKRYCAYPALDLDPAFAQLRGMPEFQKIRQEAIACQQRFLHFRSRLTP